MDTSPVLSYPGPCPNCGQQTVLHEFTLWTESGSEKYRVAQTNHLCRADTGTNTLR